MTSILFLSTPESPPPIESPEPGSTPESGPPSASPESPGPGPSESPIRDHLSIDQLIGHGMRQGGWDPSLLEALSHEDLDVVAVGAFALGLEDPRLARDRTRMKPMYEWLEPAIMVQVRRVRDNQSSVPSENPFMGLVAFYNSGTVGSGLILEKVADGVAGEVSDSKKSLVRGVIGALGRDFRSPETRMYFSLASVRAVWMIRPIVGEKLLAFLDHPEADQRGLASTTWMRSFREPDPRNFGPVSPGSSMGPSSECNRMIPPRPCVRRQNTRSRACGICWPKSDRGHGCC